MGTQLAPEKRAQPPPNFWLTFIVAKQLDISGNTGKYMLKAEDTAKAVIWKQFPHVYTSVDDTE